MRTKTTQYFQTPTGRVPFVDMKEQITSARAQPRDIRLLVNVPADQEAELKEQIAVDIRRGEGEKEIGIRTGLKFEG